MLNLACKKTKWIRNESSIYFVLRSKLRRSEWAFTCFGSNHIGAFYAVSFWVLGRFVMTSTPSHDGGTVLQRTLAVGVRITVFFLNGPFPASFLFIFVFSTQLTVNKCSINFADDWIRTADLWYRKRPLYQLSHTTTAHVSIIVILSWTKSQRDGNNYLGLLFNFLSKRLGGHWNEIIALGAFWEIREDQSLRLMSIDLGLFLGMLMMQTMECNHYKRS